MMEECSLRFIFDNTISEIKSLNEPEYGQYVVALEKDNLCRRQIIVNYDEIRDDIRKKCERYTDRILLDRHKCAASFMIAILNYMNVEESELSKEYFAIFVGLALLRIAIIKEGSITKNHNIINHLNARGFLYPKCIRDAEPYPRTWALGIHYGRLSGNLSVLSLANSLYWIERYNRDLAGG
jgi:hypothetical protein